MLSILFLNKVPSRNLEKFRKFKKMSVIIKGIVGQSKTFRKSRDNANDIWMTKKISEICELVLLQNLFFL